MGARPIRLRRRCPWGVLLGLGPGDAVDELAVGDVPGPVASSVRGGQVLGGAGRHGQRGATTRLLSGVPRRPERTARTGRRGQDETWRCVLERSTARKSIRHNASNRRSAVSSSSEGSAAPGARPWATRWTILRDGHHRILPTGAPPSSARACPSTPSRSRSRSTGPMPWLDGGRTEATSVLLPQQARFLERFTEQWPSLVGVIASHYPKRLRQALKWSGLRIGPRARRRRGVGADRRLLPRACCRSSASGPSTICCRTGSTRSGSSCRPTPTAPS